MLRIWEVGVTWDLQVTASCPLGEILFFLALLPGHDRNGLAALSTHYSPVLFHHRPKDFTALPSGSLSKGH